MSNVIPAAVFALPGYWVAGWTGYVIAFAVLWFFIAEGDARREAARRAEDREFNQWQREQAKQKEWWS